MGVAGQEKFDYFKWKKKHWSWKTRSKKINRKIQLSTEQWWSLLLLFSQLFGPIFTFCHKVVIVWRNEETGESKNKWSFWLFFIVGEKFFGTRSEGKKISKTEKQCNRWDDSLATQRSMVCCWRMRIVNWDRRDSEREKRKNEWEWKETFSNCMFGVRGRKRRRSN